MPKEIDIKRPALIGFILAMAGLGLFLLFLLIQSLPDIKGEVRLVTM